MIQSVTFGDTFKVDQETAKLVGKNTYDDWQLLATSRPIISPPAPKTNYIDIPGGNGSLDLTESLTGFPLYSNREGSFQFRVLNVGIPWSVRYSEILEYLHGKAMKLVLEDDPDWFYKGRFSVSNWTSGATWSIITINYVVEPYKWYTLSSLEGWLWNPFNFETGVIPEEFKDIVINSPTTWVSKTFDASRGFGSAPISPVFLVSEATNLKVRFVNNALGIDKTLSLVNGRNDVPDFIFHKASSYTLQFMGIGTVSIEFRKGML